jgi:soluble lytic murein transglycosylase-like protein
MRPLTIAGLGLLLIGLSNSAKAVTPARKGGSFKHRVKETIQEIAPKYWIPPDYLFGICMAESSCNPKLLTKKHHRTGSSFGLYGLTEAACKDVGVDYNWLISQTGDNAIYYQTETAAKYLSKLFHQYKLKSIEDAIKAYHIGIGNFLKGRKKKAGDYYLSVVLKEARQYRKV